MLASGDLGVMIQAATLAAPVAGYFFLLGLLNSRPTPRMLTGRTDFAMLMAAMSPLVILPAMQWLGATLSVLFGAAGVIATATALLAPREATWVVYNLPAPRARRAVARALEALGGDHRREGDAFESCDGRVRVRICPFPLLRNVTVRMEGGDSETARRFAARLGEALADCRVETSPMAVTMLLVATAMLLAPLTLMAHRVPELVRLLTNLLP